MEMTNEEIIKSYNEAKNKQKQIKILADLNSCRPIEIKKIVGIEEPKQEEKKATEKKTVSIDRMREDLAIKVEAVEEKPAELKSQNATVEPVEAAEPIRMPRVEPPESIIRLATKRLEELEETIKAAELEYKEIASFLGMGA